MPVPTVRLRALHLRSVLLLSLVALMAVPAASQAATGSISGTVEDAAGAQITSGDVCVEAYGWTGTTSVSASARSSAGGAYTLSGLVAASYSLWFADCDDSARNDLPRGYGQTPDANDVVTVADGAAVTGIDVELAAAATISGHVYGGDGTTPLGAVCVTTDGASTTTSDEGAYTLRHVRPGTGHRVYADPCTPGVSDYLPRYVGDTNDYASALVFTPTVASPTTGADVHLVSGATISGTVVDAAGDPITTADICVTARPDESDTGGAAYRQVASAPDGAFTVRGLSSGTYNIAYADCGASARNDVAGSYGGDDPTAIALQAGATHGGVALQLAQGTTIAGHVYGGAGSGTPLDHVCVNGYAGPESATVSSVETDSGGAYTLRHVAPATVHKVRFSPCGSTSTPYLAEYYDNKSDLATATAVTAPAAGLTTVDAHLSLGASVSGVVNDAAGHPITTQNICVSVDATVSGDYEGSHGNDTTDAAGAFEIVGLKSGTYNITMYDCGSDDRNDLPLTYTENGTKDLVLTAGQAKSGIVAQMAEGTSISGHVYGGAGTGTPLNSVCVAVALASNPQSTVRSTSTDAEGAYRLKQLAPSTPYVVRFAPCGPSSEYSAQYYDGQESASSANAITPTVANPSTGIDAHLPTGASIAGMVRDATGDAITTQDICVSVSKQGGGSWSEVQTDATGAYRAGGLDPGAYYVRFADCSGSARNDVAQYYGGATTQGSSTLVVLSSGGSKTGVDAHLAAGTTIDGVVYDGAGTSKPIPNACVTVFLPNQLQVDYVYAITDAAGAYHIRHLLPAVGGYRVKFSDCASVRTNVDQYYGGDYRPTSGTLLKPTAAQPATGIDGHLPKGATISGVVRDGAGPIAGGICIDASRVGSAYDDYYYSYAYLGANGQYTVGGLPAGSYSLSFRDCDDERNDLDQYLGSAVTVSTGEAVTAPDVLMRPAASIRGHVYGGPGNGTPLGDVCVSALIGYSGGGGYPGDYGYGGGFYTASWAYTNADGSYVLKHLDPGQPYKVQFNTCFDDGGLGFGGQFYDGVADFGQAATLRPTVASPSVGIDAHLPRLDAAPATVITGGPAPNAATNQTAVRFSFVADQVGATFECAVDGGAYSPCASPFSRSGLSAGGHSFSVRARNNGRVDAHPPFVSWTVDASSPTSTSHGTVSAGGTFSSDAGAAPTAAVPVVATVTLPSAGSVTLTKEPATTPSGNGYTVFGQQIDITATASDRTGAVTGSVANPIALSFQIAGSQLPAGTDPGAVTVMRNGSPAPACSSDDGTASPDPCVAGRRQLADGGLAIDLLTTHCSTWNFATTSAATIAPANTSPPTISGDAQPGSTLTAEAGAWSGSTPTYAYAWLRDGQPISGATGSTYVVSEDDRGHALSVRVTATNAAGHATATSAAVQVAADDDDEHGDRGDRGDGGKGGGGGGGSGGGSPGGGGSAGGGGSVTGTGAKAPALTFGPLRGVRLAGLLRSGLTVRLSCASPCRADVRLTVPAAVGRQLKLGTGKAPVVIGSASAKLTGKQRAVSVRLTAKARKALRRLRRSVAVTVVVRARDAGGASTSARTVTVKR